MKKSSYHFVNIEDLAVDQADNGSENHCEDVLKLEPANQDTDQLEIQNGELSNNSIIKPKYCRLDRLVFAEPIEKTEITQDLGTQDEGEIITVDNVMVKKTPGKRNKYFIDLKDGCLDCPLTNCTQTFASKALLKAHVRKVHCATTKYMCEECGAGFTARYLLKRHSAIHSGDKKQCNMCGKWLSQRTSLSVHMLTHGGARTHACAACGKRFLRRAALLRHERFVHGTA